ncbi:MAG TPA: hypothetical protein VIF11_22090 [Methylomirabilota bacterium]|jgi:hypothetical protein
MTKATLALCALLILSSCTTTANLKATPLKEQGTAQIDADRKRCDEWSKHTAVVLAGFAACLIAAGYETTPQIGSTSQTLRLTRSTDLEPTRVLLEMLDCDSIAKREAETDLGFISRWIRENLFSWRHNTEKRRQVFVDCIKPRGYDVGKS